MHTDDPKSQPDSPADESPSSFDIRDFESMPDDEADAEWLRHPEAWHLH